MNADTDLNPTPREFLWLWVMLPWTPTFKAIAAALPTRQRFLKALQKVFIPFIGTGCEPQFC